MATGEAVGLCLDIDGTVYREGSAFVEVLLRLPDAPECGLAAERGRLRRALGTVGRYRGGWSTALRWRAALRAVDAVRTVGGERAASAALDGLRRFESRRKPRPGGDPAHGAAAYKRMRESLLSRYGEAIAGEDATALRAATTRILRERRPIDPGTATTLAGAARAGVDLALVTDMPAHVAEPFAEAVVDAPVRAVRATRFGVDGAGRFTGSFDTVDKGEAVAALCERFGWERTVAAGDTVRDLPMAGPADTFVAVGGQGQLRESLSDPLVFGTDSHDSPPETVYVPRDQPLAAALRFALGDP